MDVKLAVYFIFCAFRFDNLKQFDDDTVAEDGDEEDETEYEEDFGVNSGSTHLRRTNGKRRSPKIKISDRLKFDI